MSNATLMATPDLLDMALRRCLLGQAEWQQAKPPLDPAIGEECRDLELTASRSFLPRDLESIVADESRLHGLTLWALYALLSKPFIIQFQSTAVRWRSAGPPQVTLKQTRPDRVEVVWSWVVQFCAPSNTDNVYLNRMAPAVAQLTLF